MQTQDEIIRAICSGAIAGLSGQPTRSVEELRAKGFSMDAAYAWKRGRSYGIEVNRPDYRSLRGSIRSFMMTVTPDHFEREIGLSIEREDMVRAVAIIGLAAEIHPEIFFDLDR